MFHVEQEFSLRPSQLNAREDITSRVATQNPDVTQYLQLTKGFV